MTPANIQRAHGFYIWPTRQIWIKVSKKLQTWESIFDCYTVTYRPTVATFDHLYKSNSATFGLIWSFCKTLVIVKNWRMCPDWWSPVTCNWPLSFISDILSLYNIWEYVVLFRAVKSEKEDLCIPKDISKDILWYNANGKCLTKNAVFTY